MGKKIEELYEKITLICIGYYFERKQSIIGDVKKILPQIAEMASWYIENSKDSTSIENLNQILEDMLRAVENRDKVLMGDTLDFGLRKFMVQLLPKEYVKTRGITG